MFDDSNSLIANGPISRIAFISTLSGISGMSVWHGTNMVSHGYDVSKAYSEEISGRIESIKVYHVEATGNQPGRFVSFSFSTTMGKTYQFGTYIQNAQFRTFNAPPGQFLGAVSGNATADRLTSLTFIWAKAVTSTGAQPTKLSATNYIVAASKTGGRAFDDTNNALSYGRLTKINYLLGATKSGLVLTYGQYLLGHGQWKQVTNASTAVSITTKIHRVRGTYLQDPSGYFGSLELMSNNGWAAMLGTPLDTSAPNVKTFDSQAPPNAYLGAFRGFKNNTRILQLSLVWFVDK